MNKPGRIVLGLLRTIVAPIIAYVVMYLLVLIPIWTWGWAAKPIDLTNISVIQIVLIIVAAIIIISCIGYWFMALWMIPGLIHRTISPRIKWLRITTASLLSVWIIIGQIITAISGRNGLMTDRYGDVITMPAWLIIYISICCLISVGGLIITSAIDD